MEKEKATKKQRVVIALIVGGVLLAILAGAVYFQLLQVT